MGTIKLNGQNGCDATFVNNIFIDEYMPKANGEFVKIYLYLLRALSRPNPDISLCHIADVFNHTEMDIVRALKYWEQAGLLSLGFNEQNKLTSISIRPATNDYVTTDGTNIEISISSALPENALPEPKLNTPKPVARNSIKKDIHNDEFNIIVHVAEKYIGKVLNHKETETLFYIYDDLGFDMELMDHLIDFCVSTATANNNKPSIRYIEKVALDWASNNIHTVSQAKAYADTYNRTYYPVLKAFGITGRNPGNEEKSYIVKWTNSYGFTMDIIVDACNRTISNTSQPSFKYADSILTRWYEKGIKHLSDVKVLDEEHEKNKANAKNNAPKEAPRNNFNNFSQREYNYDLVEKQLLNNR